MHGPIFDVKVKYTLIFSHAMKTKVMPHFSQPKMSCVVKNGFYAGRSSVRQHASVPKRATGTREPHAKFKTCSAHV